MPKSSSDQPGCFRLGFVFFFILTNPESFIADTMYSPPTGSGPAPALTRGAPNLDYGITPAKFFHLKDFHPANDVIIFRIPEGNDRRKWKKMGNFERFGKFEWIAQRIMTDSMRPWRHSDQGCDDPHFGN